MIYSPFFPFQLFLTFVTFFDMQEETGEGVSLVTVGLKDGSPADFYILDTTADGGNHRNLFR
jgi:hypothetical protein